jgi:hypothetical protein
MRSMVTAGLCCLLAATQGRAQLGRARPECERIWGKPTGGAVETNGTGVLRFERNAVHAELSFAGGGVRRAVYRPASERDLDVRRLLELNRGDAAWDAWAPPGIEPDPKKLSWVRDDEGAMARLRDGVLTVAGPAQGPRAATALPAPAPRRPAPLETTLPRVAETASRAPERSTASRERAPKPSKPANLPTNGDAKSDVTALLGAPTGTMKLGGREAMAYPWGNVWLRDGVVIGVE